MNVSFLEKVIAYSYEEISRDELRLWIANNLSDLILFEDNEESELIGEIEGVFADAAEKGLDETSVRLAIRSLIPENNYVEMSDERSFVIRTGTSTSVNTIVMPFVLRMA